MNILVCIKQVADQESKPIVNQDKTWAGYSDEAGYWINRYDEHAVEEALKLRESVPGTVIHVLSIGPPRVKAAIRRCLEMGAEQGFHLLYDSEDYISPSAKSLLIADFCHNRHYDLILTGVMSEDMMSGQTGPMIAARLGIPSATSVMKLKIGAAKNHIHLERELDSGSRCSMQLTLPALVAVQSGINRPRYPSLSNVMRAKTVEIHEIYSPQLPAVAKYEAVEKVKKIGSDRVGLRLEGSTGEKAAALWQILHEKSLI